MYMLIKPSYQPSNNSNQNQLTGTPWKINGERNLHITHFKERNMIWTIHLHDYVPYYPPVNKHSNGKSPCSIGNTSSNGGFSIAMGCNRPILLDHTSRDSFPKHNGDDLAVEKTIKGIYPLVNSNISMDHPHSQYKIHIVFKSSIFSSCHVSLPECSRDIFVILHPGFIYQKH